MLKIKKYKYIKVLQGKYCDGWDDLIEYETPEQQRDEIRADIKAYKQNEPQYIHRLINRRVLNV